jgi:hypothetical protein
MMPATTTKLVTHVTDLIPNPDEQFSERHAAWGLKL